MKIRDIAETTERGLRIQSPTDVLPLLERFRKRKQEHFIAITLSAANGIIGMRVITIGTADRTLVHPREIFRDAITDNATAVIVAHNHPSGTLEPSREDRDMTQRLKQASEILGIRLLDHIIIGKETGYYSFLEKIFFEENKNGKTKKHQPPSGANSDKCRNRT